MPGLKRSRAQDDVAGEIDDVHPSRKRRLEFSKTDAKLAKIYGELAEHDSKLRLQAAIELLETIKSTSSQQDELITRVLERLIKGLCSSNKAARLGFSVALSEVVRLALDRASAGAPTPVDLTSLTARCIELTQPDLKASGQQSRDCLLGRRFAFQSILQSDAGLRKDVTETHWRTFLSAVTRLAAEKDWLRSECGAMLYEYLSSEGSKLKTARVQALVDALQEAKLLETAEGVALWVLIAEHWEETLPKGVWSKKDPLSSDERAKLKRMMISGTSFGGEDIVAAKKSGSGTRQSRPTPAWHRVLDHLYRRNDQSDFTRFWQDVVAGGLLAKASSDERKALGLQIASLAVSDAPEAYIGSVMDEAVMRTIVAHRAENTRYLYDAAKQVLDTISRRGKSQPTTSFILLQQLLRNGAFDQQTRTKTVETLMQQADVDGLDSIVNLLHESIFDRTIKDQSSLNSRQRVCADLLLNMIRGRRTGQQPATTEASTDDGSEVVPWLEHALRVFVEAGYQKSTCISETTRTTFRSRLTSSLASLLVLPSQKLSTIFSAVLTALAASQKTTDAPLDKPSLQALKTAGKARKQLLKGSSTPDPVAAASAFDILFGLSMLQVYNGEPDSAEALNDLQASYEVWQEGEEASTGLIELLLSFLAKPSRLLRKLSEQVFTVFAKDMTAESLQSLVDILQQKESLSGQQELFKQDGEEDDNEDGAVSEDEEDDAEAVDIEDMSDVELVNGAVLVNGVKDDELANGATGSALDEDDESDESDSSSDTSEDAELSAEDEDEETEFDRKLALALGSAAANGNDSGSDDSDLDDDQMMAFEEPLTNVFREQKKVDAQRQDNKGAKENMINFKNRVLDLLSIYVKSQYGDVLALDLILPLTMLVRTSSRKPTQEKAYAVLTQYFDACTKHKSLPRPDDTAACFEVLAAVHEEIKLGGSKLQGTVCSRSSLFLAKVLVAMDVENYQMIGEMYLKLQMECLRDSKVASE
ncbi:DNA-directed DNA polymerase [Recurvomyces mirabilis]|uniref:DNA-directed DNA polymerase n=1 Tax=Recurvomyces mirabilis TaxID=574656 RepID=A0AAE0WFD0_9PEZI|nr:DNA-directed DNA polymerase [Recurvomyces mirabilis]KAK5152381.1 DNA-directed DNA polymerase [Recurvomyces mirabilis]